MSKIKQETLALTDEQREELIASCKFEIESLNEEIEGFDAPDASDYLAVLKSELLRQQIALAALNAEAAGNFTYHEDEDGDPTDFIVESDGFAKNSFKLYTAPPVPALKPIALPPEIKITPELCEAWAKTEDLNLVVMTKPATIKAIRAFGYEVKE